MKRLFKTIIFVSIVGLLAVIFFPVAAQIKTIEGEPCQLGIPCGKTWQNLYDFITKIVNYVLRFAGLLAALVLIWGGIKYIISLGSEDEAEQAKKLILYAIIGLIVIGLAAATVNFVTEVIGGAGGDNSQPGVQNLGGQLPGGGGVGAF